MRIQRRRLTLLELVICLGILAALASLLLDNFADVKARECDERTVERGTAVGNAVTGRGAASGVGRFLSDMGRWPKVFVPSSADGGDQGAANEFRGGRRLAELYDPTIWYRNGTDSALGHEETIDRETVQKILHSAGGSTFPAVGGTPVLPYPEVSMPVGWRGPYLNMARPQGGLCFDGWGRAWKIVTRYNLRIDGNRLEENRSGTNPVQIYADAADFNTMRANGTECRIDGVVSYGANDAEESGSGVLPSNADLSFLFPHHMDNYGGNSFASLTVELRVREASSDGAFRWKKPSANEPWRTDRAYAVGDMAVYGSTAGAEKLYCCREAHAAGSAWDSSRWIDWSGVSRVDAYSIDPAVAPVGSIVRYNARCYYRATAVSTGSSNPEEDADWLKLFEWNTAPDQVGLLLFTPVMRASGSNRIMSLGYYHFYRTAAESNPLGVRPMHRASSTSAATADLDCDTLDTSSDYSTGDYNGRYLTAEDRHLIRGQPVWNEFSIDRLVPGRRRISGVFYNSKTGVYQDSGVEWIELLPGENRLVLYLERKP